MAGGMGGDGVVGPSSAAAGQPGQSKAPGKALGGGPGKGNSGLGAGEGAKAKGKEGQKGAGAGASSGSEAQAADSKGRESEGEEDEEDEEDAISFTVRAAVRPLRLFTCGCVASEILCFPGWLCLTGWLCGCAAAWSPETLPRKPSGKRFSVSASYTPPCQCMSACAPARVTHEASSSSLLIISVCWWWRPCHCRRSRRRMRRMRQMEMQEVTRSSCLPSVSF